MTDLKTCRVLVTPRSYAKHDSRLRSELEAAVGEVIYRQERPLTSEELQELLPGCDGFIAGLDAIDQQALDAADQLKVIARYGAGVDQVNLDAAKAKGVVVANTPGVNSVSVAELALGLMLSLARQIPSASTAVQGGEWPRIAGVAISGKVVGLVGLGAIGREVARRLQGFDCTVLAYDPYISAEVAQELGVQMLTLDEVVAQADYLSLHVPVTAETSGMVNAGFLRQMKAGSFLINTARGALIDEAALLEALESGHLRGAGLDALSEEPPPADHPLLAAPQVIVTPHTGAHTDDAVNAMGWGALNACLAVLRGEEPDHRVV